MVCEDEPVLQAFKLMRQKGVGAVPVVESGGNKAIANISIRDIQFLLLAPAIYKNHRTSCIYLGENVVFPVNEGTTPCWLSLKALGRARLGMSKREFLVVAKARKMHSDDFSEIERSGKTWRQDQKVKLQHVETLDYLQSHDKKFSRTAGVSKRFLVKN